jgi:hypothetical protein
MKVASLPLDPLVVAGQHTHRLATALTPLLATGHAPLGFRQSPLRCAVMPRILDDVSFGGDEKHLQPHVDARLLSGCRQRLAGGWTQ